MGNEGSIPVSEEELETQARAPPSATLPSSSSHSQQPTSSNARSGRMINAVFHRRNQGNAAASHPPGAPPMQPEDMVLMSMDEQQLYYQQQEQQQQDLYLQMQQQQQLSQHSQQSLSDHTNGEHAPTTNATPKKGMAFRPTGRAGAAFINSMKNLNIGSAVLGRASSQANHSSPSKGTRATSKEWETRWDEDDDDDDDSEEEFQDQTTAKPPAPQHLQGSSSRNGYNIPLNHNQHAATTMPPLIRPGMDMGLSSPTPQIPSIDTSKAHLVTATPEPGAEDGVEWDTGVAAPGVPDYEKPNMQMFLPLLRVLGKGSFGKVRTHCSPVDKQCPFPITVQL